MIKELSEKAKVSVPQGLMPDKWIETYNKILVELVVKECIDVLDKDDGATHHAELLEEHFGIR